jgi:peptide-methionine (S)-S-oxide reductase
MLDKLAATQSMTGTGRVRRRILQGGLFALAAIPLTSLRGRLVAAAETAVVIPPPALDGPPAGAGALQTAVLAGGCFWGVQAVYQHTKGVTKALSGYAGGQKDAAHYEMVGTGRTGHAESVSITYDPQQISYGKILQIYFSVAHNPTELNRQGPDFGTQYRSAIFYADDEQKRIASAYIAQLQ